MVRCPTEARTHPSRLGQHSAVEIFPAFERVVVGYGLSVPSDPQVTHRAADGWSAFGDGVHAAGATAKAQHDSVSAASWQAPARELYGQVAGYAMGSDTATGSAHGLSWLLRMLASLWTLGSPKARSSPPPNASVVIAESWRCRSASASRMAARITADISCTLSRFALGSMSSRLTPPRAVHSTATRPSAAVARPTAAAVLHPRTFFRTVNGPGQRFDPEVSACASCRDRNGGRAPPAEAPPRNGACGNG